jgi:hypothetical protein
VKHEVHEMRAQRLVRFRQVQRHARVAPVELGRLDQPLGWAGQAADF